MAICCFALLCLLCSAFCFAGLFLCAGSFSCAHGWGCPGLHLRAWIPNQPFGDCRTIEWLSIRHVQKIVPFEPHNPTGNSGAASPPWRRRAAATFLAQRRAVAATGAAAIRHGLRAQPDEPLSGHPALFSSSRVAQEFVKWLHPSIHNPTGESRWCQKGCTVPSGILETKK